MFQTQNRFNKVDKTDKSEKKKDIKKDAAFNSRMISREYLNCQTFQQAVFISLLNQHCDIKVIKPVKRSVVTDQFIRIHSIVYFEEEILFEDLVDQRCMELKDDEMKNGTSEKTATRRYQTYRRIETNHLLMDMLYILDYDMELKMTEGKKGISKLENCISIGKNGKMLINNKNEMNRIGKIVNNNINRRFTKYDEIITLPKGYFDLNKLLVNCDLSVVNSPKL